MNCIDDERIKFYLEYEDRIKEWAAIGKDVPEFAHRFYLSLQADVDDEIRKKNWEARSCVRPEDCKYSKWPYVGLRRTTWPHSDADGEFSPKIVIEWLKSSTGFSPGHLVCGVQIGEEVEESKRFDLCKDSQGRRKVVPAVPVLDEYPEGPTDSWFRYRRLERPDPGFWKDDGLAKYRKYLLDQLCKAWTDFALLMDEAAERARE